MSGKFTGHCSASGQLINSAREKAETPYEYSVTFKIRPRQHLLRDRFNHRSICGGKVRKHPGCGGEITAVK